MIPLKSIIGGIVVMVNMIKGIPQFGFRMGSQQQQYKKSKGNATKSHIAAPNQAAKDNTYENLVLSPLSMPYSMLTTTWMTARNKAQELRWM